MFSFGLVLVTFVAAACGDSGKSFEELDHAFDESIMKLKMLVTEDPSWLASYDEIFGLPEEEEEEEPVTSEPHTTKEQVGNRSVWKVLLIVAVLLLALVGVLSTVYYLCVWRGGRIHYEPQKEIYT